MFYLEYKTIDGTASRNFEREEDALKAFDLFTDLYRYVTLTHEQTTTTTQVIRDSSVEVV